MKEKITVFDKPKDGTPLELQNPVGEGGEGAVYVTPPPGNGKKQIAIKIFNKKKLGENREELHKKIAAMVEMGKENKKDLIRYPMIAWPQLLVYDSDYLFTGYGMKYAKGKPLSYLAHPKIYEKYFPDMDREKVAKMLIGLWNSVEKLHEHNIYIGDVNSRNVLCSDGYVPCWIDCDSFQVNDFRCPVGRPEMTPPEHLDKSFSDINRTQESDLFSLAILTFQCLMLGRHPYEHIGGTKPVENLRKGAFPYATGGARPETEGAVPRGQWHKIWSHYTYNLKNLFVQSFTEGNTDPSKRPSAEKWIKELENYIRLLNHPRSARRADGSEYRHPKEMIPKEEKPQDLVYREKSRSCHNTIKRRNK